MKSFIVSHSGKPFEAIVHLPSSKSISNRALIVAALCKNPPTLTNVSESADTQLMRKLLSQIDQVSDTSRNFILNCDNAGTVFRFLTAFLSTRSGTWELTGSPRMKERPIGPLVEALQSLGAQIDYTGRRGFPPIRIEGKPLSGGQVTIDPRMSSQFVTALLLIAPTLDRGLAIRFAKPPSSLPYIHMTLGLLRHFGIEASLRKDRLKVRAGIYSGHPLTIEPDWSAASFWFTIVALSNNGSVHLPGLQKNSLQGDSLLPEIFNSLGVKSRYEEKGLYLSREGRPDTEFQFDFTDHPDLLQPVLATCAGLGMGGIFTGLESLRIKETDRIAAMVNELNNLGIGCRVQQNAERTNDSLIRLEIPLHPPYTDNVSSAPPIHTYGDHRMAMAFAPLAQRLGPLEIRDPDVVVKSYPRFWNDLTKAEFAVDRKDNEKVLQP